MFTIPNTQKEMVVRFLPAAKGRRFYESIRIHHLAPNIIRHCQKNFVNGQWEGSCGYCDLYCDLYSKFWTLANNTSQIDFYKQKAQGIKPYERHHFNVIVRDTIDLLGIPTTNAGPLVYAMGLGTHRTVTKFAVQENVMGRTPWASSTTDGRCIALALCRR